MSIIFEALRRVEREKGGGPPGREPVVFDFPGGTEAPPARPPARRAFRIAAAAAAAAGAMLLARPDWFGVRPPAPAVPPPPEPAAPLREVRLEPRGILASPPEAAAAIPPPAATARAAADELRIPDLRLKGLSRSGARSWAFINDRMLKVGDTIEGAEVVAIAADRVTMRYRGVEFVLSY